ncbi:MAG: hypothetical protein FJ020_08955 [Chloroflexi bacterium]|nr:hypothetical protein [Chloroflexota bacterium]
MSKVDIRNTVALLVVIAMIVAIAPMLVFPAGVGAVDNASIEGTFTLGSAAPIINTVTILESDGLTPATSLTPMSTYYVRVNITDDNTLDDLATCNVTVLYDTNSNNSTGDIPADGATQAATLQLNVDTSTWSISDGGSTWDIVTGSCSQPTLTNITGDFTFCFTVGKIATEYSDWDFYVAVADDSANGDTLYEAENLPMNWYGEIAITDGTLAWGQVLAGTGFGDGVNEVTGIEVNYIANGAYDEQVATDDTAWGGSSTLVASETLSSNQFAIKVDDEATYDGTDPQLVNLYSTDWATIDVTGAQTTESGDDVTNTFWPKLGSPFVDANYSGTIYFKIANGS